MKKNFREKIEIFLGVPHFGPPKPVPDKKWIPMRDEEAEREKMMIQKREKANARKAYWKAWGDGKADEKAEIIAEEGRKDDEAGKEMKCKQMTIEMMRKRKK